MTSAKATILLLGLVFAGATRAADKVVWKPLEQAVLRIDERPPRTWNVYRTEKKEHLLLVQVGRRFLMLDLREHQIYELDPAKLQPAENALLWRETHPPGRPLSSADWTVRDAGRAKRIRARLVAEGRVLEVQVPQQLDLRSLY